jgi:hypothetical protein
VADIQSRAWPIRTLNGPADIDRYRFLGQETVDEMW